MGLFRGCGAAGLGDLLRRRGLFPDNRASRFVGAQTVEHRVPDDPGARPFPEGNLRDELRLYPVGPTFDRGGV